jgi:hypothetical protein
MLQTIHRENAAALEADPQRIGRPSERDERPADNQRQQGQTGNPASLLMKVGMDADREVERNRQRTDGEQDCLASYPPRKRERVSANIANAT